MRVDVEMTSLEDAYVNMAKQEEVLHRKKQAAKALGKEYNPEA